MCLISLGHMTPAAGFRSSRNGVQKRKVDFLVKENWEKTIYITLHKFDTWGERRANVGSNRDFRLGGAGSSN